MILNHFKESFKQHTRFYSILISQVILNHFEELFKTTHTFLLCVFICHSGDDDDDEEEDEDDDDDELLKRTGNYVAASEALPKGIIKVCVCV